MKMTIDRSGEETQRPIIVIDTKTCHYPYAIRNAIRLALELDGYTNETIDEVFGINSDKPRQNVEAVKEHLCWAIADITGKCGICGKENSRKD